MTDIVKFKIPPSFVDANACLSMREIAYGYAEGWIDGRSVADLCLRKYEAGRASELEEKIALALSDQVDELLGQLAATLRDRPTEGPARAWCYLALAWTFENRAQAADPFGVVEMLYADFEYPEEIECFVRFMPPPPGEAAGEAAMLSRWATFLDRKKSYYLDCDHEF